MAITGVIGNALKKVAKLPVDAEKQIASLRGLEQADFRKDLKELAASMRPHVIAELDSSYRGSGVKIKSGVLYRATVTGVTIAAGETGFNVFMAPRAGYKKGTANVYGSAGAKKYGGVRVRGLKRITGKARRYADKVKGAVVLKPYPDFFEISVNGRTVKAFEDGLRALLRKRGIATNG